MGDARRSILLLWISLGVHAFVFAQGWQEGPGCRFKELMVSSGGKPGFTLLPPRETGVWFTNSLPESRSFTNTIAANGSGVAAGDMDGDGLCDLFFCGLGGGSRLYRNLGGWHFEDITERAGIRCTNLDATGAVFADINGDGHLDLLVNSIGGGTHVFINDGQGRFRHSPLVLNAGRGGTSLALADTRGRGWLDLYVANYRASTIMDAPGTRFSMKMVNGQAEVALINGRLPTDPEWTNRFRFKTEMDEQGRSRLGREELGEPDVFFRNDGQGGFEAISWTAGCFLEPDGQPLATPPFDWGLSVVFRDFNGDGWPDIYVCNDFQSPDRFWLNDGQGHFEPLSWTRGRFLDEDGKPLTSPPRDWGLSAMFRDLNGDGLPDLYVCNDYFTPDRVWINQGKGIFRALPSLALRKTCYAAMAVDFADINRDGFDDLFVTEMLSRDHVRRQVQHSLLEMLPVPSWGWGWTMGDWTRPVQVMRNTLSLNRGDGTYAEIAQFSGVQASEWSWGL